MAKADKAETAGITEKAAEAARAEAVKPKKDKAEPKTYLVVDTTATPDSGPRTHHVMVDGLIKPFTFEAGKAVELPAAIAHKLLKFESFVPVDDKGNRIEYRRTPKQPDQLGAGEQLALASNETVARYDELSSQALHQRVTAMIGGEKFATKPEASSLASFRAEMIAFVIKAKEAQAKANKSKEKDSVPDGFTPEPEDDSVLDADDEDLAA